MDLEKLARLQQVAQLQRLLSGQEFAHHAEGILVFLQDVLMPRRRGVHLCHHW